MGNRPLKRAADYSLRVKIVVGGNNFVVLALDRLDALVFLRTGSATASSHAGPAQRDPPHFMKEREQVNDDLMRNRGKIGYGRTEE